MITIDKLCYTSRLRYENAAEKFAFAVITLIICVIVVKLSVQTVTFYFVRIWHINIIQLTGRVSIAKLFLFMLWKSTIFVVPS